MVTRSGVSVNEKLAGKLHKPIIKNSNGGKSMLGLKAIFG